MNRRAPAIAAAKIPTPTVTDVRPEIVVSNVWTMSKADADEVSRIVREKVMDSFRRGRP